MIHSKINVTLKEHIEVDKEGRRNTTAFKKITSLSVKQIKKKFMTDRY